MHGFGRLDVMFNNAGVTGMKRGQSFEDHTVEDWQGLTDMITKGVAIECAPFEAPPDDYVKDDSRNITGVLLPVDGGYTAH